MARFISVCARSLAWQQTRSNTYNSAGVIVFDGARRYIQDLASPLSQVLQMNDGTTTSYEYGAERLASKSGMTRTWYLGDALGSVRRTVADTGTPNAPMLSDTFSIRRAIIPVHSPRSLAPTPHR